MKKIIYLLILLFPAICLGQENDTIIHSALISKAVVYQDSTGHKPIDTLSYNTSVFIIGYENEYFKIRVPKTYNIGYVSDLYFDYSVKLKFQNKKDKKKRQETKKKTAYSSGNNSGYVRVKGYYRKDGTYVRPHTRKSPRRRR